MGTSCGYIAVYQSCVTLAVCLSGALPLQRPCGAVAPSCCAPKATLRMAAQRLRRGHGFPFPPGCPEALGSRETGQVGQYFGAFTAELHNRCGNTLNPWIGSNPLLRKSTTSLSPCHPAWRSRWARYQEYLAPCMPPSAQLCLDRLCQNLLRPPRLRGIHIRLFLHRALVARLSPGIQGSTDPCWTPAILQSVYPRWVEAFAPQPRRGSRGCHSCVALRHALCPAAADMSWAGRCRTCINNKSGGPPAWLRAHVPEGRACENFYVVHCAFAVIHWISRCQAADFVRSATPSAQR